MKYSYIPATGLAISKISLGTLIIKDKKTTLNLFEKAISAGINCFDTSDGYLGGEAEKILGDFVINQKRENIILGSKAFFQKNNNILEKGLTKKNIFHTVETSLKNLKTEYLDIFYCHRFDENTPIEETLEAIEILIKQGKILNWGICGFSVYQLCKMYYTAQAKLITPPAGAQYAYNLFNRSLELEISEALDELKIGVLSYYPLAQGILTGKYNKQIPRGSRASNEAFKINMWDYTPEKIDQAKKLSDLASSLNTTATILSINWCLMNVNVKSVITSVSSSDQLDQLLHFDTFHLAEDVKHEIELIFDNHPKNQYTGINF